MTTGIGRLAFPGPTDHTLAAPGQTSRRLGHVLDPGQNFAQTTKGFAVAGAGYAECYTQPNTFWIDLVR